MICRGWTWDFVGNAGVGDHWVQVNSRGAAGCAPCLGELQVLLRPHGPRCVRPHSCLLPLPTPCLHPRVLCSLGPSCGLPKWTMRKLLCPLLDFQERPEICDLRREVGDAWGWLCRGACDTVERAFNYAWMQAGLGLDSPGQQQGQLPRVWQPIMTLHWESLRDTA